MELFLNKIKYSIRGVQFNVTLLNTETIFLFSSLMNIWLNIA